ncbi:uncharacterized protein N7503_005122 [Penicillium pulvis]|uniref:uncharacterized protein n=1 Tax=Penicillium pulvis TaxID=1562058 RepID=UPI0025472D9F|nr:uncharacterized protein N7503_005122 [Penicillium pulvis]KAJ5802672.1 hypothetical protein N7503_005122 [Penicillium pulvis]
MSQSILSDEVSQCNFEPADDVSQKIDAYDDCSNKDNDHKILLDDDEIPWKISIYPPPGRNLDRLVAWQIERHIQWIDDSDYEDKEDLIDCKSKDKDFFCSTFRMCTAKDLKNRKPFNDGNLGIKIARTEGYHGTMGDEVDQELKDCPWGRPAAALLVAARSYCNNPEDWMLLDEPRKLLIAMEKWYFDLDGPEQQSLAKNAWCWTEMQEAEKEKWNQAFSFTFESIPKSPTGLCSFFNHDNPTLQISFPGKPFTMVNIRDPEKAAKDARKKLKRLRKKGHSYRKILLSLTKLKLEDKERKSKMAYLERKLDHKRIALENLRARHKFNNFLTLNEKLAKKGEEQDDKFLKEQEKYDTDIYLEEIWGRQIYMVASEMYYSGRKGETETDSEDHNITQDDSEFYEEIFRELPRREECYFLGEEQSLIKSKTKTENDDETSGLELEQGAIETKAAPKPPRGAELEGKQGRITVTATAPENNAQASESSDSDDELLIRFAGDNIKNLPDRDNFNRSVAWQIERHIQWAGDNPAWGNKKGLCSTLDVKSATDFRRGKVGRGNLALDDNHCAYDREGYHWGRPAEELRAGARRFGISEAWMMYDEPRRFLIALENWYFQLDEDERDELFGDVFQWYQFRDAHIGDKTYAPKYEGWESVFGEEIMGFYGK